ncbi:hypothetical protein [Nostoc sp.]
MTPKKVRSLNSNTGDKSNFYYTTSLVSTTNYLLEISQEDFG